MIAYILSTGDEVLLGDIVDTNSTFLCNAAKQMGIDVKKIIAVGDDVDDIAANIKQISLSADICLVTGGLGPTQDDLTAQGCSRASQSDLELNLQALESMQEFFHKKGFELNKENEKQAILPAKSKILINDAGTAPGFYIQINSCWFYFMPGVPSEMKIMFEKQVQPQLIKKFKLSQDILVERLTIFGLPESTVGQRLKNFNTHFPEMRLGFRADFPVIEVKIILSDRTKFDNIMSDTNGNDKQAHSQILAAKQWAMEQLEYKVVSKKGRSIAQEVGSLLIKQGKMLAIAESCTGGLISNKVTDVAGSSQYFLFSGITYSNEAKMKILGVNERTLIDHGAVHEKTAIQMAQGALKKVDADFAISTTGIAGPDGGTKEKPVGMVCIGVATKDECTGHTYTFHFGDRSKNKQMFATMALELLRRCLVESGKAI